MRAFGLRLVPVLVVVVLATAGCGASPRQSGASGEAAGADDAGTAAVPTASPTSTAEELGLDPCALLGAQQRSSAGLSGPGEHTTVAGSQACDYVQPGAFGVTVTVDERADLPSVRERVPHAEDVQVGELAAVRVADPDLDDGTCSLTVSVERPGARTVHVDVTMADFQDTDEACERATTVAELIEPELT
ncbi:DUF3558 family protein [Saccharomonospora azurea]|uniref:DUF3558 family protein n=1 Tax=Saccharomonospora azurea TaxID=40988 RepID=UPI00023FEA5A|nr:DUF3558 family protein [Saccharomonospora azurea]EHK86676.1 hypothetical protein SZMC14600_14245 [Saccharomonospora azurea SZMC 14600]